MANYSGSDRETQIDTLARTIEGEAGDQSFEGKLAVGNVVANRVAAWGGTIASQAKAPGQFTAWNSLDNGGNVQVNKKPSKASIAAATAIVDGTVPDNTGGATYYNVGSGKNVSAAGKARQATDPDPVKIGAHTFYNYNDTPEQTAAIRDRFANPSSPFFNPGLSPAQMAIDNAAPPAPTFADRARETIGAPISLGIRGLNAIAGGVGALLGPLANIVNGPSLQPAFAQPAHPSTPTPLTAPIGRVEFGGNLSQRPEYDADLFGYGRTFSAFPQVPAPTPTNDLLSKDFTHGSFAPSNPVFGGAATQGDYRAAPQADDNIGGLIGTLAGGMMNSGPQSTATQPSRPYSPTPSTAYASPVSMPIGFDAPDTLANADVGSLSAGGISPSVGLSPQTKFDQDNLSAQIAAAMQGPAPGAITNPKPGELGYTAPAPVASPPKLAVPQPAPKPAPVAAPRPQPLAPTFAVGSPVFNDLGSIVGAINSAGKAFTPTFADNTPVFSNGVQVGTISGKTMQAQPLSLGSRLASALGFGGNGGGLGASFGGVSYGGGFGGFSEKGGTTGSLGGGRMGNDSGQQHA
jgi:hypothetical protein